MKTVITITLLLCGFICKGQVIAPRKGDKPIRIIEFDKYPKLFNHITSSRYITLDTLAILKDTFFIRSIIDKFYAGSPLPVYTGTEWTEKDRVISNQARIIENKDSIISIQKRYIESLEAERDMWKLLFLIANGDGIPVEGDKVKTFNQ